MSDTIQPPNAQASEDPAPAPDTPQEAPTTRPTDSAWDVYWPKRDDTRANSVRLASFPLILYFWPTLITFVACACLQGLGWVAPATLGWWGLCALAFNLLVLVTNLDQKKFLIAILSLALAGLGIWIGSLKGITFFSAAYDWLGGLEITLSTHAYAMVSCLLVVFSLLGLIQPRVDYWRLESNEFVHYLQPFGRDQSIPRQGSTVTREVPDILEFLLSFGGGTLVIRREGQAVARIDHVPFLGRRMVAIERLLGVTRVESA
jgi:hypothetical protein